MSRKGALARLAVGSVALVLLLHSAFAADRPLIGIYTQDSPSSYSRIPGSDAEYIAASYAKLVESAGARPVPVSYNLGEEDLVNTLESLDGFVFPGGGMDLSLNKTYAKSAQVVLEYAVKSGRDDFPVVGICLGFQLISTVVSQTNGVLSAFDSSNLLERPSWVEGNYANSSLSQFYPPYSALKNLLVFENHHFGVSLDSFHADLSDFFDLLAIGKDRKGSPYVAAVEAKNHNIFGFQFHPEKNTYEWKASEVIPHDYSDLEVTRGVSKLLAYYSRGGSATGRGRRRTRMEDPRDENAMVSGWSVGSRREREGWRPETDWISLTFFLRSISLSLSRARACRQLIYNFPLVFTAPYSDESSFEQIYFFPKGQAPGRRRA